MGPWPETSTRDPRLAKQQAIDAGLVMTDLREEWFRTVFYDIGAIIYLLRVVIWIVTGFSVQR
jgi:hypothetical protein